MVTDNMLQITFANVIQQLANFFGMTTETIMANAPEWLAKYGWYMLWQKLPSAFVIWGVIIFFVFLIIFFINIDSCVAMSKRTYLLIGIISFIILLFIITIMVGQCAVSPELYGLNALLNLLKSN